MHFASTEAAKYVPISRYAFHEKAGFRWSRCMMEMMRASIFGWP
ncbi:hypothetical protein RTCIAT899_PC01515 (plasmid) [Rhizobium tropici CIAT 899]|nr:hypothetical protein RTCIAT899_PC01515 [Rhizobium tropici CIAT 899]